MRIGKYCVVPQVRDMGEGRFGPSVLLVWRERGEQEEELRDLEGTFNTQREASTSALEQLRAWVLIQGSLEAP